MQGLRAIAEEAGVAPSTVSFVLNGRASAVRISEATQTRVREAARRLGYAPNVAARRLRVAREGVDVPVLAILAPVDARLSLISRVVHGVRDSFGTGPGAEPELLIETFKPGRLAEHRSLQGNHRIHGAIVLNATPEDEAFLEESDPAVPVVLFQRESRHSYVQLDNRASGKAVAEHLLALGHRRVASLVPAVRSSAIAARYESFRDTLVANGVAEGDVVMVPAAFSEAGGAEAMRALLASGAKPVSAVFALSDPVAIGAISAAKAAGLRVPEDLSVVGHDGLEVSAFIDPPLTTVVSPASEMGARAAAILLDLVQRRVEGPVQEVFTPELIVRRSTGPTSAS